LPGLRALTENIKEVLGDANVLITNLKRLSKGDIDSNVAEAANLRGNFLKKVADDNNVEYDTPREYGPADYSDATLLDVEAAKQVRNHL